MNLKKVSVSNQYPSNKLDITYLIHFIEIELFYYKFQFRFIFIYFINKFMIIEDDLRSKFQAHFMRQYYIV